MTVDKGRFTQRIELFESQRNDVQSYFDKGIQELKERSVKGAKLLERLIQKILNFPTYQNLHRILNHLKIMM